MLPPVDGATQASQISEFVELLPPDAKEYRIQVYRCRGASNIMSTHIGYILQSQMKAEHLNEPGQLRQYLKQYGEGRYRLDPTDEGGKLLKGKTPWYVSTNEALDVPGAAPADNGVAAIALELLRGGAQQAQDPMGGNNLLAWMMKDSADRAARSTQTLLGLASVVVPAIGSIVAAIMSRGPDPATTMMIELVKSRPNDGGGLGAIQVEGLKAAMTAISSMQGEVMRGTISSLVASIKELQSAGGAHSEIGEITELVKSIGELLPPAKESPGSAGADASAAAAAKAKMGGRKPIELLMGALWDLHQNRVAAEKVPDLVENLPRVICLDQALAQAIATGNEDVIGKLAAPVVKANPKMAAWLVGDGVEQWLRDQLADLRTKVKALLGTAPRQPAREPAKAAAPAGDRQTAPGAVPGPARKPAAGLRGRPVPTAADIL